jgi:hypothetical protein
VIQTNRPCDAHVHAMAIRMARACRNIIQAVLREEEWGEADREFYLIIREGLEAFQKHPKGGSVRE